MSYSHSAHVVDAGHGTHNIPFSKSIYHTIPYVVQYSNNGEWIWNAKYDPSLLVFAYPFHFGKYRFSATFSRQIRISGFHPDFYVQAPYTHTHIKLDLCVFVIQFGNQCNVTN